MRLRGHHLFCVQGFKGFGYNQEFTSNFARVTEQVKMGIPIQVVEGPDDICKKCPHLHGERCTWGETNDAEVRNHDKVVMENLDLMGGQTITISEVISRFSAGKEKAQAILNECAKCPWTNICGFWERFGHNER